MGIHRRSRIDKGKACCKDKRGYELYGNPTASGNRYGYFNDDSTMEAPVTWKQEEVDALKTATYGDYQVSGSVDAFTYTDKLSGKRF